MPISAHSCISYGNQPTWFAVAFHRETSPLDLQCKSSGLVSIWNATLDLNGIKIKTFHFKMLNLKNGESERLYLSDHQLSWYLFQNKPQLSLSKKLKYLFGRIIYQQQDQFTYRSRHSQMFFKIDPLKNLSNSPGKHLCWSLFKVFSCEICEIFKNTLFYRTPPLAASVST